MKGHEYAEAVKLLTGHIKETGTETVQLDRLHFRVLAQDITAGENVPAFDRSPYDGYAFRSSDTKGAAKDNPVTLQVIENIKAGQAAKNRVSSGKAVRLMTGAPIPEGADAVCKMEDTDFTEKEVTLKKEYRPGENVICAGEDMKKGSLLAGKGTLIDTGMIGILASLGFTEAKVYRKPAAGLLTTGDEVTDREGPLPYGTIRNSNRYTIKAALEEIGLDTVYLGHAGDRTDEIRKLILKGEESCDIIISTGGVSVGDYDLVPEAMEQAGFKLLLQGVDMKPGMACAYGVKAGRLMLALSGNPASSLTNLQCVCYPALRKLAGLKEYEHKQIRMKLKHEWKKGSVGTRFLRGRIELSDGCVMLDAPKEQGNVLISSTKECNAYGMIPEGYGPLQAGEWINGFQI